MMIFKVLYSSIVQPRSYESSAASKCWVNADDTVRRMPNLLAMFWLRCVSWQTAAFGAPRRVSGDCQAWTALDRIQLRDKLCRRVAFFVPQVEASIPQRLATLQGKRPIQPMRRAELKPTVSENPVAAEVAVGTLWFSPGVLLRTYRSHWSGASRFLGFQGSNFQPCSTVFLTESHQITYFLLVVFFRHVPKVENSYYNTKTEVYDPEKISVVDLLRWFWESHDPTQGNGQGNDRGTQYRHLVEFWAFCTTEQHHQHHHHHHHHWLLHCCRFKSTTFYFAFEQPCQCCSICSPRKRLDLLWQRARAVNASELEDQVNHSIHWNLQHLKIQPKKAQRANQLWLCDVEAKMPTRRRWEPPAKVGALTKWCPKIFQMWWNS